MKKYPRCPSCGKVNKNATQGHYICKVCQCKFVLHPFHDVETIIHGKLPFSRILLHGLLLPLVLFGIIFYLFMTSFDVLLIRIYCIVVFTSPITVFFRQILVQEKYTLLGLYFKFFKREISSLSPMYRVEFYSSLILTLLSIVIFPLTFL